MSTGIYKITNLLNGKCYIGQSINIQKRWTNHKTSYKNPNKDCYNYPLYKAFRKYGLENFKFEILEECTQNKLDSLEKYWIKYYNSYNNGYNQTEGGEHSHFNKLNKEKVLEIISYLRNSKENSEEIGKKFGVSGRTIRAINSGESCKIDNVKYPIRPRLYNNGCSKGFVKNNKIKNCPICGKPITGKTQYCQGCAQKRVLIRPSALELAKEIYESSFLAVGKKYNVSDNTIRKWCKSYNIPSHKKELCEWYLKQINKS